MILMYPKIKLSIWNPCYEEIIYQIAAASGICYNADIAGKEFLEAEEYVRNRITAKHESVIEHKSLSVEFTIDRGVSHELVRHRLASFTQSSTRYCDYSGQREDGQCRFIIPPWVDARPGHYDGHALADPCDAASCQWICAIQGCESSYRILREKGWKPEQARSVLPNSLMTKILVTANIREWQHILRLRAVGVTGRPHPQMEEVMVPLLFKWTAMYPVFFQPLYEEHLQKYGIMGIPSSRAEII
jgi:thymidylate synthase (FAD)